MASRANQGKGHREGDQSAGVCMPNYQLLPIEDMVSRDVTAGSEKGDMDLGTPQMRGPAFYLKGSALVDLMAKSTGIALSTGSKPSLGHGRFRADLY